MSLVCLMLTAYHLMVAEAWCQRMGGADMSRQDGGRRTQRYPRRLGEIRLLFWPHPLVRYPVEQRGGGPHLFSSCRSSPGWKSMLGKSGVSHRGASGSLGPTQNKQMIRTRK